MKRKILKNKPLVEAIFELRWHLKSEETEKVEDEFIKKRPPFGIDPHYKLLAGRLYDKLVNEYSYHEQLPAANMPDEIAGYIVQHRFRKEENGWPLIQLGPGILTVNDTEGYKWEDFKERIKYAVESFFSIYPNASEELKISSLTLRYIDAIDFNYENDNIFIFLKEKMKTNVELYQKLFENTHVNSIPSNFDLRFEFESEKPKGRIFIKFGKGRNRKTESDTIMWETIINSKYEDLKNAQQEISKWIDIAHEITDDWFFKLIEGELEKRFE